MGRQKPNKPRRERPTVTVHEVRTPEDLRAVMEKMIPKPKTGDWRPDVIGVEKISMQPGPDGWPLINGHRVTEEMCAALQADRPAHADHFVFEDIVEMAETLGPPQFEGMADVLGAVGGCSGLQLDHKDGSMSCSRGENCPGVALPHQGWSDCGAFGPCAYCAGPPVKWASHHAPQ
ncbi:MAG: hypothetical protein JWO67_1497 [Streptosporangiaceae bacterium]|nr:hypothetical protein [Streptosporangiaceae bacterium]